jgi:hypothetical protein
MAQVEAEAEAKTAGTGAGAGAGVGVSSRVRSGSTAASVHRISRYELTDEAKDAAQDDVALCIGDSVEDRDALPTPTTEGEGSNTADDGGGSAGAGDEEIFHEQEASNIQSTKRFRLSKHQPTPGNANPRYTMHDLFGSHAPVGPDTKTQTM